MQTYRDLLISYFTLSEFLSIHKMSNYDGRCTNRPDPHGVFWLGLGYHDTIIA